MELRQHKKQKHADRSVALCQPLGVVHPKRPRTSCRGSQRFPHPKMHVRPANHVAAAHVSGGGGSTSTAGGWAGGGGLAAYCSSNHLTQQGEYQRQHNKQRQRQQSGSMLQLSNADEAEAVYGMVALGKGSAWQAKSTSAGRGGTPSTEPYNEAMDRRHVSSLQQQQQQMQQQHRSQVAQQLHRLSRKRSQAAVCEEGQDSDTDSSNSAPEGAAPSLDTRADDVARCMAPPCYVGGWVQGRGPQMPHGARPPMPLPGAMQPWHMAQARTPLMQMPPWALPPGVCAHMPQPGAVMPPPWGPMSAAPGMMPPPMMSPGIMFPPMMPPGMMPPPGVFVPPGMMMMMPPFMMMGAPIVPGIPVDKQPEPQAQQQQQRQQQHPADTTAAGGRSAPSPPSPAPPPAGQQQQQQQQQQQCPAPQAALSPAGPSHSSDVSAPGPGNAPPHDTADSRAAAACAAALRAEMVQFDVAALRSWVVSAYCEDVYLMLLDCWRPDSPLACDTAAAWRSHVRGASQPDYRAFMSALFGEERLAAITSAARSGEAGSPMLGPEGGELQGGVAGGEVQQLEGDFAGVVALGGEAQVQAAICGPVPQLVLPAQP